MQTRAVGRFGWAVGLFLLASTVGSSTGAQTPQATKATKPEWVYAHDLRVRKGGQKDFNKDTQKIGVEFFRDATAGALLAISQSGQLAVLPLDKLGAEKKATWKFAHDLRVRKSDEEVFTPATTKYGVEVFQDSASGKLLYVDETAGISLANTPAHVGADGEPKWHHALVLKVRGSGEAEFGSRSRKFGIEVFKDSNTGGLVYVSETGSLAIAPAPATAPAPDQVKPPKALYGLDLRVRKSGEADFSDKTKTVGVEVFRDENTGGLLYISQSGAIAAVPTPATIQSGKGVTWKHAMELKARSGGEADFAKANTFGIEVFQDNNTGYLVYVDDAGGIAVLVRK
ncbi:MAG: hypothetical protein LC104_21735 [Bacteroidales bacterium]|nr:hypothetical protein [Bacteroidales bacterium]